MTARASPRNRCWPFQLSRPMGVKPIAGSLAHIAMAIETLGQPLKKPVVVGGQFAETARGTPRRRHICRGQLDQLGGGVHHAITLAGNFRAGQADTARTRLVWQLDISKIFDVHCSHCLPMVSASGDGRWGSGRGQIRVFACAWLNDARLWARASVRFYAKRSARTTTYKPLQRMAGGSTASCESPRCSNSASATS